MSNSFGSSNLFSGAASNSSATNDTSYAPPLGLRQRGHSSANTNGNVGARSDENVNPNSTPRENIQTYGKWGAMSKVPAPPRVSLATAGKFNTRRSGTTNPQQLNTENGSTTETNHRALVPMNEKDEDDLSLWVVGYGYRNEAHFRALYHRLESSGVITARRGGLSCFGEGKNNDTDNGNNWVAVRYESALCAHKAVCQHGNFVSIGGSTMVIGVMHLSESDAAAKLGINVVNGSSLQENVTLSGSFNIRNQRELRTEADIMLHEGEQGDGIIDNEVKSTLDSLCGKVLAWFFMWDTRT
mmetsp:Transcript_16226/g.35068  ORF Transcript_16226/g.35068 Transcript_16226/m.35068 type:complete len:299 (+) Transcript_16226:148-1044(+)|eukprot:CAMPEP_0172312436 /NCGR_PEP_ID=MMETSP1058-20130122/17493_1 /TAXON_ID=83371 /ORGANISM="Detonula confervacea, Strain CCMP 353" /LENGTH=298 /DNA_ID=CAMNT_0013025887 /DNA_START=96 /DNA_END=992 /DNA_ORIENTATION=+